MQRSTKQNAGRVVVAGGSGLIGRALVGSLLADGWAVDVLTRDPRRAARRLPTTARTVQWSARPGPDTAALAHLLADADGVINLSGTPLAPKPWTAGRRRAILQSRVDSTTALVEAISVIPPQRRPPVLVNASGTDVYTDQDDEPATESAPPVNDYLSGVVQQWEAAARAAEPLGVRVVLLRTAFVFAPGGQIMRLLTLPFRLFVGGRIGSGGQWFSWVHVDDVVGLYRAALVDPALSGPVNVTAPEPVRQRDLARAIGRATHRPSWVPVPAWLVRLALRGQSTLVLGSRRVAPARAEAAGYVFRYPDLDQALADVL
jgi:uncharacterized protein (TIGR01777 family)